jgi:uncharacterized protein involved in outer membrane biogenesis
MVRDGDAGKIRWRSRGTRTPDIAIDLVADVGDTHAKAKGTLFDPVHLGNLDIELELAGGDLAHLYPILQIPLPPTPEYTLKGHLVSHDDVWTFKQFEGKVGESDLAGDFTLDRSRAPQMLRAELVSDTLRLEDLRGFIGAARSPSSLRRGSRYCRTSRSSSTRSVQPMQTYSSPVDASSLGACRCTV